MLVIVASRVKWWGYFTITGGGFIFHDLQSGISEAVFQNSLPVLKINSLRYMHYRFSALAVNFETVRILLAIRSTKDSK